MPKERYGYIMYHNSKYCIMIAKHSIAIKTGIIGGITLILALIAYSLLFNMLSAYKLNALAFLLWISFYILVAAGVGIVAIHYTRSILRSLNDVMAVLLIAGFTEGLTFSLCGIIVGFVFNLLSNTVWHTTSDLGTASIVSLACGPIIIIENTLFASVVATVCGTLYVLLKGDIIHRS